ncbi:hypothetical protein BaRGS_00011940, partial [Batillaria attramentaria]
FSGLAATNLGVTGKEQNCCMRTGRHGFVANHPNVERRATQTANIHLDLQHAIGHTGSMFVGVTMDTSFFKGRSNALHTLARALSPCYLRIGGTAADTLIFNAPAQGDNFTLTAHDWDRVHRLTQFGHWDLIFDLNVMLRHDNDKWDPTNARQLLRYSDDHGYNIACFQLGNEPNFMQHKFHRSLSGSRLAQDYQILKSVLREFPRYQNSCILGPEVTKLTVPATRQYLEDFLESGGNHVVSAVSLHHYYYSFNSHGVRMEYLTNSTVLDLLKDELNIANAVSHRLAPGVPIWFTETNSASGADPDYATQYVAGFIWMDKLGLSAQHGIKHVIRHSFFYRLVTRTLKPNPDYFLTLLHKKLIQGPVLKVHGSSETVRVYAHCSHPSSYPAGAVAVMALNIQNQAATLTLPQFRGQQMDVYLLTAGDQNGLTSEFIALNGEKLEMVNDQLPPLAPKRQTGDVHMPAYSFAFVVIPTASAHVCKT